MNDDFHQWNLGLIFALLCVILGAIGVVSAQHSEDRKLTSGLLFQGIILIFVVAGKYYRGAADLHLGGLAIVALLILQSLIAAGPKVEEEQMAEDDAS